MIDLDTEILIWFLVAGFLIVVGAWIPILIRVYRYLFAQPHMKDNSALKPEKREINFQYIWRSVRCVFSKLRQYPRLIVAAIMLVLIGLFCSGLFASIWLFVVFCIVIFSGCLLISILSQKKIWVLLGSLILGLVAVRVVFGFFYPQWELSLAEKIGVQHGLTCHKYGNVDWLDPPDDQYTVHTIDHVKPNSEILKGNYFSLRLTSWLFAPKSGQYSFFLTSDDGSFLKIDDKEIISNPGYHAPLEVAGDVNLESGFHRLQVDYFNGTADAAIKLHWKIPDGTQEFVNPEFFFIDIPSKETQKTYRIVQWLMSLEFGILLIVPGLLMLAPEFELSDRLFSFQRWKVGFESLTTFRKQSIRMIAAHFLLPAFVGVLVVLVFSIFYYSPEWAPVEHGFNVTVFETENFQSLQSKFNGGNGCIHSRSNSKFRRILFSSILEGFINVKDDGIYTVGLRADNGARCYIDETMIIDGWKTDPRDRNSLPLRLDSGLHSVKIEMFNKYLPAFVQWTLSKGKSDKATCASIWDIYTARPDEKILSSDLRFQDRISLLKLLSGLVCVIGFAIMSIISAQKSRFRKDCAFLIYCSISAFALTAGFLKPEHRFGLQWFVDRPFPLKLLILGGIYFLFMPKVRGVVKSIPDKIEHVKFLRIAFFIGALAVICMGQWQFTHGRNIHQYSWALVCYAISFLLVFLNHKLVGNLFTYTNKSTPTIPEIKTVEFVLFSLIVYMAVFLRFYRLYEMPPGLWWDETQTAIVAKGILRGSIPPIYDLRINAGTVTSYFVALWFKFFGNSVFALRSYFAAVGVVTVAVSYYFFRRCFNCWFSLFGIALLASSRWLFSINRVAMATIDETILLTIIVISFYSNACRTNKTKHYLMTGVLLGLALHLHTGGRVLPVIVGADILYGLFFSTGKFLKTKAVKTLLMIIVSIIVFSPMGYHILKHREDYFNRSKQTLLINEYPGAYPVKEILENSVNYFKMYPLSGDWHPRHNIDRKPQLPGLVAILAFLGVALFLSKLDHWLSRFFVLGFMLITLQGSLTIHNDTANLNRVAENIPIVYLWAVFGLFFVFKGLRLMFSRRVASLSTMAIALTILTVSTATAYRLYFNDYLKSHTLVGVYGFQPYLTESAAYIKERLNEKRDLHIWAEHTNAASFRYILPGHGRLHDLTKGGFPRINNGFPREFVFRYDSHAKQEQFKAMFPGAVCTNIPYSLDSSFTLFRVYSLPAEVEVVEPDK